MKTGEADLPDEVLEGIMWTTPPQVRGHSDPWNEYHALRGTGRQWIVKMLGFRLVSKRWNRIASRTSAWIGITAVMGCPDSMVWTYKFRPGGPGWATIVPFSEVPFYCFALGAAKRKKAQADDRIEELEEIAKEEKSAAAYIEKQIESWRRRAEDCEERLRVHREDVRGAKRKREEAARTLAIAERTARRRRREHDRC